MANLDSVLAASRDAVQRLLTTADATGRDHFGTPFWRRARSSVLPQEVSLITSNVCGHEGRG